MNVVRKHLSAVKGGPPPLWRAGPASRPWSWATLSKGRNAYQDACLKRLSEVLDAGVKVAILADRGFGDTELFGYLGVLGFDDVIRFRGDTHVMAATGERRLAADWVGKGGLAVKLSGAMVAAAEHPVGAVVCVHAKDTKEPWCVATSLGNNTARATVDAYARRWTIEPSFRDTKDTRFAWAKPARDSGTRSVLEWLAEGYPRFGFHGPTGATDCCC